MKKTVKLELVNKSQPRKIMPLSHSAMAALLLEVHAGLQEDPELLHLSENLEDVLFELMCRAKSSPSQTRLNPIRNSQDIKLVAV